MAKELYSPVSRRMWLDQKFCRLSAAPPNAQTLFLRLLTGPEQMLIPGVVPLGGAALAEALRWPKRQFDRKLGELLDAGMVVYDPEARLFFLPRGVFHRAPSNPKQVLGWRRAWPLVPECALKQRIYRDLSRYLETRGAAFLNAFEAACLLECETVSETEPIPSPEVTRNRDQEQEQEQDPSLRSGRAGARPPPVRILEPPNPDTRKPSTANLLGRQYQERYYSATGDAWQSLASNQARVDVVARWVDAQSKLTGRDREAVVAEVLDAFFADDWATEARWPWGALAKDPARYLADRRKAEAGAKESERDRLKRELIAAYQRGDNDAVRKINEQLAQMGAVA